MKEITPPVAGGDVCDLWKVVAELVRRDNALNHFQINLKSDKNKLTRSDSNASLDLNIPAALSSGGSGGSGGSSGSSLPLPDLSLYDASDEDGPKLGITNGRIAYQLPSGMTAGGLPAYVLDVEDGYRQAWAVVSIDIDGDSDTYGVPTSITFDTGEEMPNDETDGSVVYLLLGDFSADAANKKVAVGSGAQGIGSQAMVFCANRPYFWRV